jgi:TRAP-type C4-dicarboxylate transport system substrate-binding protein
MLFAAAVTAALVFGSSAGAQEKLKFAIFTPENEITNLRVFKPWAEQVTKDSGGTLDIQSFPNGALGRNPGLQTKLLQDGVADIAFVIPSYTPGVFLDDDVFELPNVVQSSNEGSLASWRLVQKNMLRGYEPYHVIGLWVSSPFVFATNFPVRTADDLKGKKIRAVGMVAESVKALGAVPEGLPISQLTEAISRGVVDGATSHPISIHEFGIARVTNSHYLGKVGTITLGIFMNKAKFDALPPQAKAAIEKNSGEVLSRIFGKMVEDRSAELIGEWKKDPRRLVVEQSKEEAAAWDRKLAPILEKWESAAPRNKALLAALRQELAAGQSGK